jgi:hypothetical protein
LNGVGDRQNRRALPWSIGRSVVIVVVVSRVIMTAMFVLVVAEMEVEVEETGAEFPVPMPVAGCVKTETTDTNDGDHPQDPAHLPGTSDHDSAEVLHLAPGLILTDPLTIHPALDTRYSIFDPVTHPLDTTSRSVAWVTSDNSPRLRGDSGHFAPLSWGPGWALAHLQTRGW